MKKRTLRSLLTLAVLLTPLAVAAQKGEPSPRERAIIDHWIARIERADLKIKEKDYKAAERLAEDLLDDFSAQLLGGTEAKYYYGVALVRRSLARAGREQFAEAQWDWDVARSFLPELPRLRFGPRIEPVLEPDAGAVAAKAGSDAILQTGGEVKPPVVLRRTSPQYTAAGRAAAINGTVVIESVIDHQGQVGSPKILKSLDPGLDFAALEAVREWRFEPAQLNGQPVAVYYVLTIQFKTEGPYNGPLPYVMPLPSLLRDLRGLPANPNNEGAPP
jgi:TonB family protein